MTALGHGVVARIVARVRSFDRLTEDNDPYAKRDFGSIERHGIRLPWKIDCHAIDPRFGSPDPAVSGYASSSLHLLDTIRLRWFKRAARRINSHDRRYRHRFDVTAARIIRVGKAVEAA